MQHQLLGDPSGLTSRKPKGSLAMPDRILGSTPLIGRYDREHLLTRFSSSARTVTPSNRIERWLTMIAGAANRAAFSVSSFASSPFGKAVPPTAQPAPLLQPGQAFPPRYGASGASTT